MTDTFSQSHPFTPFYITVYGCFEKVEGMGVHALWFDSATKLVF